MTSSADSAGVPAAVAETPSAPGAPGAANPAALTVEQLARMLSVPPGKVREHVAAGAPTGPDGRINLVHFAAWLNRELAKRDGD